MSTLGWAFSCLVLVIGSPAIVVNERFCFLLVGVGVGSVVVVRSLHFDLVSVLVVGIAVAGFVLDPEPVVTAPAITTFAFAGTIAAGSGSRTAGPLAISGMDK